MMPPAFGVNWHKHRCAASIHKLLTLTLCLVCLCVSAAAAEPVSVIIRLTDAHLSEPASSSNATASERLRENARSNQAALLKFLRQHNAQNIESLWLINAISATVPDYLIDLIRERADVASVRPDREVHRAPSPPSPPAMAKPLALEPKATAWNLAAVGVDRMWDNQFYGQNIVVATMDSGVDLEHPALKDRWRGGENSWFDTHGVYDLPHDVSGHGTQVMGIICGGDPGGNSVGIAPQARWIAVRIFDAQDTSTWTGIHRGFQWLLDPDGNPETDDAPDVVNNSWGLSEYMNECRDEFAEDIAALRAAGIAVIFAAGNTGPESATSISPANGAGGFAIGAVDRQPDIAYFSARGPSPCPGRELYPNLCAPGVSIRTADLTLGGTGSGYTEATGTSFAAAHASGAMALLLSAFPGLAPEVMEDALTRSAIDLGDPGPDFDYGYGLLAVDAAYDDLISQGQTPCESLSVAIGQSAGAVIGRPVEYSATLSGGIPPFSYAWETDGVPGTDCTDAVCTKTYTDAFDGTVTLCVTDGVGCSACDAQAVAAGPEITGTVRRLSGDPAGGLEIFPVDRPSIATFSADGDGRYSIGGIPEGQATHLVIRSISDSRFATTHSPIFVPGDTGSGFDLVAVDAVLAAAAAAHCAPADGEGLIVGIVTGPDGLPLSGVRIATADPEISRIGYADENRNGVADAGSTTAAGIFFACGAAGDTGTWTVRAEKTGWLFSDIDVPVISHSNSGEVTGVKITGVAEAGSDIPTDSGGSGGGSGGCFLQVIAAGTRGCIFWLSGKLQ